MNAASDSAPARTYRFAGVEVNAAARSLHVDGVACSVPQRVIDLLLMLCEAPRQVLTRDAMSARLWPGDQIVSDESLTQVIFRLRSVLGARGDAIVTVRGVGLRLDTDVETLSTQTPRVDVAPNPAPEATPAMRRPRTRAIVFFVTIALALIVAALAWRSRDQTHAIVDAALGLERESLHTAKPQTEALIVAALRADAQGERGPAIVQMQAAHDADAQTPFPALMLSIWNANAGRMDVARQWLATGTARAQGLDDAYLRTLARLAEVSTAGDMSGSLDHLGALIALRPEASAIRVAHARLLLQRGQRAAALEDLRHVDITTLADRRMEMALTDRASLGDLGGARAVFERLPREPDNPAYVGASGRLAYTAGDYAVARTAFARAAQLGVEHHRFDWAVQGQMLAAILALQAQDFDDAIVRLTDAQQRLLDAHDDLRASDVDTLLAQVYFSCGDSAKAQQLLHEAFALARPSDEWTAAAFAQLYVLRMDIDERAPPNALPAHDIEARGVAELIAARRALGEGDRVSAANVFAAARVAGVFETILADEARLLGNALDVPVPATVPIDPPAPPYAQFGSQWALSAAAAPRAACRRGG